MSAQVTAPPSGEQTPAFTEADTLPRDVDLLTEPMGMTTPEQNIPMNSGHELIRARSSTPSSAPPTVQRRNNQHRGTQSADKKQEVVKRLSYRSSTPMSCRSPTRNMRAMAKSGTRTPTCAEEEMYGGYTFKPNTEFTKGYKSTPNKGSVVDRLYQSPKEQEIIRLERQKTSEEKLFTDCTFSPSVNSTRRMNKSVKRPSKPIFEHLYSMHLNGAVKKEDDPECTFKPHLVATKPGSNEGEVGMTRIHSMYKQGLEKQKGRSNAIRTALEERADLQAEEMLAKACTFQPDLSATSRSPFKAKERMENLFESLYNKRLDAAAARDRVRESQLACDECSFTPELVSRKTRVGRNLLESARVESFIMSHDNGRPPAPDNFSRAMVIGPRRQREVASSNSDANLPPPPIISANTINSTIIPPYEAVADVRQVDKVSVVASSTVKTEEAIRGGWGEDGEEEGEVEEVVTEEEEVVVEEEEVVMEEVEVVEEEVLVETEEVVVVVVEEEEEVVMDKEVVVEEEVVVVEEKVVGVEVENGEGEEVPEEKESLGAEEGRGADY